MNASINTYNNHLPLQWYVARISYLESVLNAIPVIRTGKARGITVLRVYHRENKNKYKEVSPKSKHWNQTYKAFSQREIIQEQIHTLKSEIKSYYHTTYAKERVHWEIMPNQNNKLNNEFFNQLKDEECSFEKTTKYEFDGHTFRSRFEMSIASTISNFHINYKYDAGVHLNTQKDYPDFTLSFPEFNRCVFLEAMGALNIPKYIEKNSAKLQEYSFAGYIMGSDWFITGATEHIMPNPMEIETLIIHIVSLLCAKYMRRI